MTDIGEEHSSFKVTRRCWWISECPLKEECSALSWGKTKGCASWRSAVESRAFLFDHLRRSSLHYSTEAQTHQNLCEMTEVQEEDVEVDEDDFVEPPQKTRRGGGGRALPPPPACYARHFE